MICRGAGLSVSAQILFDGEGTRRLILSDSLGDEHVEDVQSGVTVSHTFDTGSAGDDYHVSAWSDDSDADPLDTRVLVERATAVNAYSGTSVIDSAAVGQSVAYAVTLSPTPPSGAPAPSCLTWDNATSLGPGSYWAVNSWADPGEHTVVASVGNSSADKTITVVSMTLTSASLGGSGYADIIMDSSADSDTSTEVFPKPHWNAYDPSSTTPVQYQRNTAPSAEAAFAVDPWWFAGPADVRAVGNYPITPSACTFNGDGTASVALKQSSASLPDSIGCDDDVEFTWDYSISADAYTSAGTSSHTIYRTLSAPNEAFHTCVDIACRAVSGTTVSEALSGTWSKFTTLAITKARDPESPLFFWHGTTVFGTDTRTLLRYANGNCGAWARFLHDALKVHGVETSQCSPVQPVVGISNKYAPIPFSILVIYESLDGQGGGTPDARTFAMGDGSPGTAGGHALVKYGAWLLDPSYGRSYCHFVYDASKLEWEDSSVEGYGWTGKDEACYDLKGTNNLTYAVGSF
jgi:hypothetical protein